MVSEIISQNNKIVHDTNEFIGVGVWRTCRRQPSSNLTLLPLSHRPTQITFVVRSGSLGNICSAVVGNPRIFRIF